MKRYRKTGKGLLGFIDRNITALSVIMITVCFIVGLLIVQSKVEKVYAFTPVEKLYDVPLDDETQRYIIKTANEYGIEPELVIAIIEKESSYNEKAVGDGGDSIGYMQIQEKWHGDRMNRLGVEDLFVGLDNIKVGIDILYHCIEKNGLEGGIVAYNQGYFSGYVTSYCEDVLQIKEVINGKARLHYVQCRKVPVLWTERTLLFERRLQLL